MPCYSTIAAAAATTATLVLVSTLLLQTSADVGSTNGSDPIMMVEYEMPDAFSSGNGSGKATDDITMVKSTGGSRTLGVEPASLTVVSALLAGFSGMAAIVAAYLVAKCIQYRAALVTMTKVTFEYWASLGYYWTGGKYASFPYFKDSLQARVHIRSLALINEMWGLPHYRNGNFGEDMRKNLRNVAVPGTGLPLSTLCYSATLFRLVLLVVYPAVCLAAAIIRRKPEATVADVAEGFKQHLTEPTDWFSLWRLNCRLASHHAHTTKDAGFGQEDKWTFITDALAAKVPVSPIMDLPKLVCKDRNEEGGMGIHFFDNALSGGDWIIQKAMDNDAFLSSMLPKNAPLSTIRIVTGSRMSFAPDSKKPIEAFSCVFRAGRAGASTDHDAILFDIDLETGKIKDGSINKEWYQLGLSALNPAAAPAIQTFSEHPDCGAAVTGRQMPDIRKLEEICTNAHMKCCPNVPLCGWDVALTTDPTAPICLLEVNLSCNFFQATVDFPKYFEFVDQHFKHLESL